MKDLSTEWKKHGGDIYDGDMAGIEVDREEKQSKSSKGKSALLGSLLVGISCTVQEVF